MSQHQKYALIIGIIYLIAVVLSQYLTNGLSSHATLYNNPVVLIESFISFMAINESFQNREYTTKPGNIIFLVFVWLVIDALWLFNPFANTTSGVILILIVPQVIDVLWRYSLMQKSSN